MRTDPRQENMGPLYWILLLRAVACACYFFLAYWDGDGELAVAAAWAPLTAEITRTGTYAEEIDAAMSGTLEAYYKRNGSE